MSEEKKVIKNIFKIYSDQIIVGVSLLVLIWSIWLALKPSSRTDLEVLSDLSPIDKEGKIYKMVGTIIYNGNPVDTALVWLILKDGSGNERSPSPPSCRTNAEGIFVFDTILVRESPMLSDSTGKRAISKGGGQSRNVQEIIVHARTNSPEMEGEKNVKIVSEGTRRVSEINKNKIIYLPVIFLISILFPFIIRSNILKYMSSIIAAFLLSGGMILTIAISIAYTSTIGEGETLSLGFAHIAQYKNEWIFLLTSPLNLNEPGFWVPLWVLLLSVIGASLFTVLIIVKQIKERPDFEKLENKVNPDVKELTKFNKVIENIVRHQFYMIFSPLGSVFVYQLLVAAEAVTQPVTVAIAALGSGPALNIILDRSINFIENTIEKKKKEEEEGGNQE